MREGHRANALLVELLLVILFFMLGSTTLVQIFADAKHKSMQARAMNVAIMEAENISDDLYGADDPDKVLQNLGSVKENDSWILTEKEYTLTITQKDEETENGVLRIFTIDGKGDGKDLFSLPSTRYTPKEGSP